MNEDGSAEGGRTRLARGTKPHALTGPQELAGAEPLENAPGPVVSHARSDAPVPPVSTPAEARRSVLSASVDTLSRAPVTSRATDAIHGGPVQAGADATVGGAVSAGLDARGSGPVPAGGAPSGAGRAP
ncbi:MAG TPA: hypothetical protein VF516_18665, partial [Kofleriaceae bacterium]